ncbi:hypothetical protein HYU08_02215 [Candidatus Woesearchaeota archaeon]|nr:hypothetical protein [Candidatus Woesearchaeota archaeon]
MPEEKVYISFREQGTDKPWQLLRVTDPREYHFQHPAAEPFDPCAVGAERAHFYLGKLAEKGYETVITQLDSKTRGAYVVNEHESLADMLRPVIEQNKSRLDADNGFTGDLQPPRRR